MFVLAAWVFGGFVMFVGVIFKTRNIHTPFRLFIVTVRHEPSRIVATRANVATRLRSSRSAKFFRGRCTLPEVHFRSPFSRHDFRCDGRDSRLRSITPFATRYGSGVLDMYEGREWLATQSTPPPMICPCS